MIYPIDLHFSHDTDMLKTHGVEHWKEDIERSILVYKSMSYHYSTTTIVVRAVVLGMPRRKCTKNEFLIYITILTQRVPKMKF